MTTETIEQLTEKVIEFAAEQVSIPKEQVSLDSQFVADLGFDSLDKVEFVMMIEEEFDIVVPDELSDKIATVRDTVNEIQKLIG